MKLWFRHKHWKRLFTSYYEDLLNAIVNDNYESIEALCENNLTLELAAKIYEFEKYHGVQFRVLN